MLAVSCRTCSTTRYVTAVQITTRRNADTSAQAGVFCDCGVQSLRVTGRHPARR